jgi:DNA adenine methylase
LSILSSRKSPDNASLPPPLKWAGGKRWLLPYLQPIWAEHRQRRLVEPLGGGLAVSLGLRPRRAWINDINPHLVNFYKWVQSGLTLRFTGEDHSSEAYYSHRDSFNDLVRTGKGNTREAARLFYYLNRTGYNGLCRFNSRGEFNVPFGRYKRINYAEAFHEQRKAFQGWEFTCGDFAMMELDQEDFVYADPPYDVEFTAYAKGGFDWKDQERLADWLGGHRGPVILSNAATERVERLYTEFGFDLIKLPAPRRISCNGDRRPAMEVLAFRNLDCTLVETLRSRTRHGATDA